MDMDVLDAILKRRSVRSYLDVPVPKDVISDMMVAGQMAPNSGNIQNCKFILVDDEHVKDDLADACFSQTWMKSAPVMIAILSDNEQIKKMYGSRGEKNYSYQNGAAIVQNMLLVATSHGLDSCWVSAFRDDKILEVLSAPPSFSPIAIITLGYGSEKVPVPSRYDLTALVNFNRFGNAFAERDWMFKNYADEIKNSLKRGAKSVKRTGEYVGPSIAKSIKKLFTKKK